MEKLQCGVAGYMDRHKLLVTIPALEKARLYKL